ncbi:response regulator transcription factor [Salirhabdus salicampi]|uniref:response regulator transcription factor n=1 Tax=Salirhabdus salicampi TaxID=476102 RepID=UPI0020C3A343|nr:response regulator [Salirhabdus salicampi]MCP8615896.1 response regulator [Salirhabdus salicampi]
MSILLVDDEPFVLEQLKHMISNTYPHWDTYTGMDGSQALEVIKHEEIHLAILDIELPGKSGLELAKIMKDQSPYTNIIMLSAHQDFEYAREAIQVGVSDYITKPVIESEFLEILQKYAKEMDHSNLVTKAVQYIQEHYHEKLNLSVLAQELYANPSYLSRKFRNEVGVTFSDFLLNYRIEVAKQRLKGKGDNISTIAEECGFGSLHYFSSVFKKKTGLTPKAFRQEGKSNEER